jgi:hypothetical protein
LCEDEVDGIFFVAPFLKVLESWGHLIHELLASSLT